VNYTALHLTNISYCFCRKDNLSNCFWNINSMFFIILYCGLKMCIYFVKFRHEVTWNLVTLITCYISFQHRM